MNVAEYFPAKFDAESKDDSLAELYCVLARRQRTTLSYTFAAVV